MADEAITLFDYLTVVVKYRRLIIRMCAAAIIMAVIVSLLLPNIYSATAVIMPPKRGNSIFNLAAEGEKTAATMVAMLYVNMLKSRTIANTIVTRFNLEQVYKKELTEEIREELEDNLSIKILNANIITITVEDKDPQRAAGMANAYVEELAKLNKELNISDATRQRLFLGKRLGETKTYLDKAENQLRKFQEENEIIVLDAQLKIAIDAAVQDENQIIAAETIFSRILSAFTRIPALGLRLGKLMREVKVQETVFELLAQQYELAKIAETKDASIIQVLDKAIAPEKRTRPRRARMIIISGMLAFLTSLFLAFIFEFFNRLKIEDKEGWEEIKAGLAR